MAFTLTYFDMRGRGEGIRLILAAAGQKFTDERIPESKWPEYRQSLDWGQLPILKVGDKRLAQTNAICRYLGRHFKLAGSNDWEAAKCDEYADAIGDLFNEWVKFFFQEKDEEKKKKMKENFQTVLVPKFMAKFETIAEKSGSKWLIGNELTWADIFIADKLDYLQKVERQDVLNAYPNLKKFKEAVFAVPNIKSYLDKRPEAAM